MRKKIRSHGAEIAPAYQNIRASQLAEIDFRTRVEGLCPGHSFDEARLDGLYLALGAVNGKWLSEWGQPEVLPMARGLARTARFLEQLAQRLGGLKTGIQNSEDVEISLLVRQALVLNPLIGDLSRADEQLRSFQRQCSEMAQVFWAAFAALKVERGKRGRAKLDWYDDFTAVLLKLAKLANIEPKLSKDRITEARGGWLFEAAQALEFFLYPPMRSPTPEACGKRLERSLKRILTS
jgi:hypothetical protein